MDVAVEQHIYKKMQRQRHACTGRHARRGTGGDSTGGEQGGIQSGDGGSTREERSVEGGDMGSTRVVGDVKGEGVVTTGGEGGVGGIEYSDADREEEERVRKFCTEGCGCALNSTPCSTQFTIEHFREMRGNAAELSWSEQNMSVMSQIMAFTFCDATFSAQHPGTVSLKNYSDSEETTFHMLSDDDWYTTISDLPSVIPPSGLSSTRQWYLYQQIREYCRAGTEDLTCPRPNVDHGPLRTPDMPDDDGSGDTPPPKRARRCGKCGHTWHTRRTCKDD